MKKYISIILAAALFAALFQSPSLFASAASVGSITGETSRTVESVNLSDGTKTGVELTTVNLTGYYGTNKVLHAAECDLSNTHLSIDVFNCGTYLVSRQLVTAAASNLSKNGKTVLAAVNGDLWMTSSYGNASKTLAVSRGAMIIDREIWATQEVVQEAGIGGVKDAFGITSKNQPLIGSPEFTVTLNDAAKGISLSADGLNRLPGDNAIIIYNNRVNSSNYALTDSYEIELESASPVFTLSGTVTATVKAIYERGSAARPAIGASTVLITARGSRISEVSGFSVGDTVTFSVSVTDQHNNTDLWYDAVDVISGHKMVLYEGADWSGDTSTSEYPTTFIGINDSGKVMLSTVTSSSNGTYKGLRFYQAKEFCRQMGYNSVFYLDGGGSATMVTLKDGTYTVRNCTSDGSPRSVINGVAITWNETPVCDEQGTLNYIRTQVSLPTESAAFIDGALLPDVTNYRNDVSLRPCSYTEAQVKTSKDTNDAFFAVDYSRFAPADTSVYKFVVIKIKPDERLAGSSVLGLFYACGDDKGFSPSRYTSKTIQADGEWQYLLFRMSDFAGWSGNINSLRLDIYDSSGVIPCGYTAEIGFIALCRDLNEVKNAKNDVPPDGSIGYYLSYLHDKNSSHTPVFGEALAPTCTESGHTAQSYCSGCGKILIEETVIAPLGHDYKGGVCTRCGEVDPDYIEYIPGDADGDGKLTAKDINIVKKVLTGSVGDTPAADIDGDGKITVSDVNILKRTVSGK
ncbi:MAG: phosphodiester glycosidase family protein [Clostridia bacterium]|nr:phosphodiester glycosidase family protein [Clostridia bacterium]